MFSPSNIISTTLAPPPLIADIDKLCSDAKAYGFNAVCVPPLFLKRAKEQLQEGGVKVSTVIAFPFGYQYVEAKLAEILLALVDGADNLEVVVNMTAIKNGDWAYVAQEINHIVPVIKKKEKAVIFTIETGLLTEDEMIKCCDLYGVAGTDVLKVSTGFGEREPAPADVRTMRSHLADKVQVAAVGYNYDQASAYFEAGASLIFTPNASAIMAEQQATTT
ncbi:deoxyribose-phosphate aldolase [Segetibacter sp. 3557_3]|uniref:deoxyribose-phosphate aldolase n=1 Tax=Segetibacter sp. 3557_3 TaxID=2547429 RepID=UPI0010588138|nr:deoxyribose-phosphate aldolase [Segetibacter sp. 3557_3]TDH26149.1 deoxyribose-phosphate aldolase [Segetibacter sp. 3557_3]